MVTTVIVLFLAIFGTVELADAGSGGGEGPEARPSSPPGKALPVQVIAQQWEFTYRFPTYGGIETAHLELPVDQQIEFHVTSLDVIHSFWAPRIGDQGRRQPWRRQRRLHRTDRGSRTSKSTATSSAASGTATCSTPARWSATPTSTTWIHNQAKVFADGRQGPAAVLDPLLPRT